jgi:MYXO-CTERM domain-containing protein
MRAHVVAASLLVSATAAASPERESTTEPYPGVTHEVWSDAAIPARMHVIRADLTSSELTVFATAEEERGRRTSAYAQGVGAQVAVNGDAFAAASFVPLGLAVGDGAPWTTTADDGDSGFLRFGRVGEHTEAAIVVPEEVVDAAELPDTTQGVVSGRPLLVRAGQPESGFDCDDEIAMPCLRAPRTAVGLSGDGNVLTLVVVDGWQAGSLGMTAGELAAFLDRLGVRDALALDGGGASTLHVAGEGGVVSAPSDGVERVVANHLAIRHGALTPGQLVGFVRERDVFEGPDLAGVLVTLDDGRTDTTGDDGLYNFPGVSPRLACVTAELDGYRTETKCKQVLSGEVNYNSIALYPCSDFPEGCATPPDAAPPPDAASRPDGGGPPLDDAGNPLVDGGSGGGGGAGCGCGAGDPASGFAALLVAIGLFAGRRRRR